MEKDEQIIDLVRKIKERSLLIDKLVKYIEVLERDIIASGTAKAEDLVALYQQIVLGDNDAADTDESE